jgi:hypothetical protein
MCRVKSATDYPKVVVVLLEFGLMDRIASLLEAGHGRCNMASSCRLICSKGRGNVLSACVVL